MGEFRYVPREGGRMHCYVALPERPNGCGVVLASSIWGVNSDLRAVADGYAALGYAAAAPNLFWRETQEHCEEYDFSKFDEVVKYVESGSDAEGIRDLQAAQAELRSLSDCGRTAAIGWCYGGRVVCLAAAQPTFELSVGMYPTHLEAHLGIADRLVRPMMLNLPEIERYGTVEDAIERMVSAFRDHPLVLTYVYAGVEHGFDFAPPHPHGDHAASRLCDSRVALCLDRVLVRGEAIHAT